MRSKFFLLTCIIIMSLSFHACTLPSSVEILLYPDLSLPISEDSGSIIDSFFGDIKEKMESFGGSVYKFTEAQTPARGELQKFLVRYPVHREKEDSNGQTIDSKINERFKDLDDEFKKFNLDELTSFDLGVTDFEEGVLPFNVNVDIKDILDDANEILNNGITAGAIPIPLGLGNSPGNIKPFQFNTTGYDSITFSEGELKVTFSISLDTASPTQSLAAANFSFKPEIRSGSKVIPGAEVHFLGSSSPQPVNFPLAGETLNKNFSIVLTNFTDNTPKSNTILASLKIETDTDSLKICGVENYNSDEIVTPIEQIIEVAFNDSFIHAVVSHGSLDFKINLPLIDPNKPNQTWIRLEKALSSDIYILQKPTKADDDPGGESRRGLCGISDSVPWKVLSAPNNLAGKDINTNEIEVVKTGTYDSNVTIPAGKISFWLNDEDLADGKIKIEVIPELKIDILSILHVTPEDLLDIDDKIISLDSLDFLTWIEFEKVGVELVFGDVEIEGLEIRIYEETLKINYPNPVWKDIKEGKVEFVNYDVDRLLISSLPNNEFHFFIDISKKGDPLGDVMEFTDVDLSKGYGLKMERYEYFFKDHWTEAGVDRSALDVEDIEGSFPDFAAGDDPLNLKEMFELIEDFDFEEVEAYLYINGPDVFFTVNPKITMNIKDGVIKDYHPFASGDLNGGVLKIDEHKKSGKINIKEDAETCIRADLPNKNNSYVLEFLPILNDRPEDLRVGYEVEFEDEIIIKRESLKNHDPKAPATETEPLTVDLVMIIFMKLKVNNQDGASLPVPLDALTDKDDLFDREEYGGSSYLDFIKRLFVSIELNDKVFNGAEFFMKGENETEGNELLKFPLTGSAVSVSIPQDKIDILNTPEYYPFKIEDIGIRFKYEKILEIPADLEAINIHIDAEIQYKFEF